MYVSTGTMTSPRQTGTTDGTDPRDSDLRATPSGNAFTGLRTLLGLVMLLSGGSKLLGVDRQVRDFERWGYPQWFRVTTGATETLGGLGLLAGSVRPTFGVVGGGLTVGTMLGALYTHFVRVRDPPSEAAPAALLLSLAALVTGRQLTATSGAPSRGDE